MSCNFILQLQSLSEVSIRLKIRFANYATIYKNVKTLVNVIYLILFLENTEFSHRLKFRTFLK